MPRRLKRLAICVGIGLVDVGVMGYLPWSVATPFALVSGMLLAYGFYLEPAADSSEILDAALAIGNSPAKPGYWNPERNPHRTRLTEEAARFLVSEDLHEEFAIWIHEGGSDAIGAYLYTSAVFHEYADVVRQGCGRTQLIEIALQLGVSPKIADTFWSYCREDCLLEGSRLN